MQRRGSQAQTVVSTATQGVRPHEPAPERSGRVTVRTDDKAKMPIILSYEAFGNPAHEALICIPGLQAQLLMYSPEWCKKMAEDFGLYVIRTDNRDAGLGSHLDHMADPNVLKFKLSLMLGRKVKEEKVPYTLKDMANDHVALLDHLGVERAHVLGASMGGMVAQELVLAHPGRVLSLICVMTSPGGKRLKEPSLRFQLGLLKPTPEEMEPRVRFGVALFKRLSSAESWTPEKEAEAEDLWRHQYTREKYVAGGNRQLAAIVQANSGDGRQDRLGSVRCPTLLLHGNKDKLIPMQQSEVLARLIPGAKLGIVDGMGHDFMKDTREMCHPFIAAHFQAMRSSPRPPTAW